jgi:hypothetical protein
MDKRDPEPPTLYHKRLDTMMHLAVIGMVLGIFAKVMFF